MTSAFEKILRQAKSRHTRRKHNLIVCEGLRACREALIHRPQWARLLVFEVGVEFDAAGLTPFVPADLPRLQLPATEFATFANTDTPQGVLLILERPAQSALTAPDDPIVLVLDRVQDPGNAGTILRTAWAVGLKSVLATTGTVDLFAPKTIRAGMGAQFAMTIYTGGDLADLRTQLITLGYPRMWEAVPAGGVNYCDEAFDLDQSALVIGNEANGSALLAESDRVTIPMPGPAESLNAAQAATLLLFEGVRRKILPLKKRR